MDTNLSPQRRGGAENENSFDRMVGQRLGSNFQKCVGGQAANKGIRVSSQLQQARHGRACLHAIIGQPEYSGISEKIRRTGSQTFGQYRYHEVWLELIAFRNLGQGSNRFDTHFGIRVIHAKKELRQNGINIRGESRSHSTHMGQPRNGSGRQDCGAEPREQEWHRCRHKPWRRPHFAKRSGISGCSSIWLIE